MSSVEGVAIKIDENSIPRDDMANTKIERKLYIGYTTKVPHWLEMGRIMDI
jgi:hypothetical protein